MGKTRLGALVVMTCLVAGSLVATPVDRLSFAIGNDWYTMGLGNNLDDRLSYGSQFGLSIDNFDLDFSIGGITDKIENGRRYDLAQLALSYSTVMPVGKLFVSATPQVGIVVAGNLGSQAIQNAVHRFLDLDELFLVYESDSLLWAPQLGFSTSIYGKQGQGSAGIDLSWSTAFGWETDLYAGLFLDLGSVLWIGGGYSFVANGSDDWITHDMVSDSYTGMTLSYRYDGGIFQTDWIYHATEGISYGSFGVDIADFWAPKTYRETDFTFSSGFLRGMLGHRNRLFSLEYRSFVMVTMHKNGPLANLPDEQETRMTVASWMVGYQYEFFETDWVRPFGRLLAGVERYDLDHDYDQSVIEELRPTIGLEGGVSLVPEGLLVTGDDTYRIRLLFSLQYVFGTQSIREMDDDFALHATSWIFMFGATFEIGHDL
jgi:hypothetical protein